ncbi:atherin-like [Triticum urartu]|uniref:atherin-like n=1 Tax=Triticum urartu TaxID=4572 RepID=UPI002044640A|nr:atherin-like [Triticum urartu]
MPRPRRTPPPPKEPHPLAGRLAFLHSSPSLCWIRAIHVAPDPASPTTATTTLASAPTAASAPVARRRSPSPPHPRAGLPRPRLSIAGQPRDSPPPLPSIADPETAADAAVFNYVDGDPFFLSEQPDGGA